MHNSISCRHKSLLFLRYMSIPINTQNARDAYYTLPFYIKAWTLLYSIFLPPSRSRARFSNASIIIPATLSDTAALTAAYSGLAN